MPPRQRLVGMLTEGRPAASICSLNDTYSWCQTCVQSCAVTVRKHGLQDAGAAAAGDSHAAGGSRWVGGKEVICARPPVLSTACGALSALEMGDPAPLAITKAVGMSTPASRGAPGCQDRGGLGGRGTIRTACTHPTSDCAAAARPNSCSGLLRGSGGNRSPRALPPLRITFQACRQPGTGTARPALGASSRHHLAPGPPAGHRRTAQPHRAALGARQQRSHVQAAGRSQRGGAAAGQAAQTGRTAGRARCSGSSGRSQEARWEARQGLLGCSDMPA